VPAFSGTSFIGLALRRVRVAIAELPGADKMRSLNPDMSVPDPSLSVDAEPLRISVPELQIPDLN
jgi:hypothetical protein